MSCANMQDLIAYNRTYITTNTDILYYCRYICDVMCKYAIFVCIQQNIYNDKYAIFICIQQNMYNECCSHVTYRDNQTCYV